MWGVFVNMRIIALLLYVEKTTGEYYSVLGIVQNITIDSETSVVGPLVPESHYVLFRLQPPSTKSSGELMKAFSSILPG